MVPDAEALASTSSLQLACKLNIENLATITRLAIDFCSVSPHGHILRDGVIGPDDELCGLCLHPVTQCIFKIAHESGSKYYIDLNASL